MPSERVNESRAALAARDSSDRGEQTRSRRLRAMDRLRPVSGRRLLDVGCGNGACTMQLARRFQQTIAIDLDPKQISDFGTTLVAAGPAAPSITVLLGTAADLPHRDAHFDVVTLIETLEHLGAQRDATLREIARVTSHGGTLYVTTPNRVWPVAPERLDGLIEPFGFRRTGLAVIPTPLDRHPLLGHALAPVFAVVRRTPLRRFCQTLVATYERS